MQSSGRKDVVPAVKGRMQARGVARRQAILNAAVELMSSRGFRGTGLAALAERVGLTEAGLLHYFDSKEDLLLAVLEEREHTDSRFAEHLAAPDGVPPLARLPEFARHLLQTPGLVRLYVMLQAEHLDDDGPVHVWFVRRSEFLRKEIGAGLRRRIERGEIRSDVDVERKSAEILAFLEGAQFQWLLDPVSVDLVGIYESYSEALIRDLAPRQ